MMRRVVSFCLVVLGTVSAALLAQGNTCARAEDNSAAKSESSNSSSGATPTTAGAAAPSSAPATLAAPGCGADSEIAAGPLQRERKELRERIMKAKQEGMGISAYLNACKALEEAVAAGATEEQIKQRISSISSGLEDQRKRSAILKTQRPTPSYGGATTASDNKAEFGKRTDLGDILQSAGGADNLINKLKDKYGGQIPDGLKDKVGSLDAEAIKNKLQDSEAAKKILEKLNK